MAKMEINERGINDYEKRNRHYNDEISKFVRAEEEHDGEFDVSDGEEEEEEEEEQGGNTSMEDDDNDETEKDNKTETTKYHKSSSVLRTLPSTALVQYDAEEMKQKIKLLEEEKKIMAKNANMAAIAEYRKKESDYLIWYMNNY